MLFASMEQPDGSFAPPAAAASAGSLLARAAPPLMVLLPAVAGSAAAAGGLGSSTLPSPVAWGMLAASVSISGGGSVLDQLLLRPRVRPGPDLCGFKLSAVGPAMLQLASRPAALHETVPSLPANLQIANQPTTHPACLPCPANRCRRCTPLRRRRQAQLWCSSCTSS